ncbi:hypothetical protein GCM10010983_25230 [Caulobacter rhizosphaerae]|nr:hypothetical protein GCM10010983_25230 [Caulobacter rhizosphaerae]
MGFLRLPAQAETDRATSTAVATMATLRPEKLRSTDFITLEANVRPCAAVQGFYTTPMRAQMEAEP